MELLILLITATFWLLGFSILFRIPRCSSAPEGMTESLSVSIIIPARNEAERLPALLDSINAKSRTADEVIVVDDHSSDGTAEVARSKGATVLPAEPLPTGWVGKTWACHQGAQCAAGPILIFLDADTILESDGLVKILDTYRRQGGALSVQPYHIMKKLSEQLSAFFNIVQMAATSAFTVFGDRIRKTGMFGPSLILDKETYIAVGGHESVKDKILEDYFLTRQFQHAGVPVHCYGGRGTLKFRMYPGGFLDVVRGWSKAFAAGAGATALPALLLVVAWISGAAGTTRHLIQDLLAADPHMLGWWLTLYAAYSAQIFWMLRRIGNFGLLTAILYPVPLLFFCVVFLYSLALLIARRPVRWKGREIQGKEPVSR